MLLRNLKQISRGLWKHKGFSFINLLGLSTAIAAVLTIYLITDYEKSFDHFHTQAAAIYRVMVQSEREGQEQREATVPYPTAKFLRNEYPGVKATQIHRSENGNIRIGKGVPFAERNLVFADSLFFSVFDFARIKGFVVSGTPAAALNAPGKAILTQSSAVKYFGKTNPIGQTLRINAQLDVEVAAVVKDLPAATHLPINVLVSYASLTNDFIGGLDLNSWSFQGTGYCYVNVQDGFSPAAVEKALQQINQRNSEDERGKRDQYLLQPLSQIHFDATVQENPGYTVSTKYLTLLLLLGGFIVMIACVNYVNLSTSLAFSKAKEIGVRKTIGASRWQLFFYYISESLLLAFVAALVGCGITAVCLPAVNGIFDKAVSIKQSFEAAFILKALLAVLFIGIVSGIYPALVLAGFKPIESLKGGLLLPGKSSTLLRRALVVFQFTTSIALIICTLVIARQMQFFNQKSLGFNKEAVIEVNLPSPDSSKREQFRALLQNQSGIQDFSFCLGAPVSENGFETRLEAQQLSGKTDYSVKIIPCDRSYLNTYGIRLIAGRWFLSGEEQTLGTGLVVNETFVHTLGYAQPGDALGKKVTIGLNNYNLPIIGVVKDFHTSSLHQSIKPVALTPFPFFYYAAGIRIQPSGLQATLAKIETAFKTAYPESVYEISFIDDQLAKLYQEETKNYNLFKVFTGISVFICCIGLWGLIAFVVVRKTKEIGIRKVLGANVASIVGLLSRDFIKLITIALVVASPIAGWLMNNWLNNFAYRISIGWWVFVVAGAITLLIAMLTISFQSVRAAMANPVKNLRTE